MPLIECYDCGKQISSLASACPNCGAPKDFRKEHIKAMARFNTCPDCNGSKVCWECAGKGTKQVAEWKFLGLLECMKQEHCSRCEGTGHCTGCAGSGTFSPELFGDD